MRKLWTSLIMLGLVATLPLAAHAEETTLTGEPVDIACYAWKGLKGAGHASCATMCAVKRGQPVGFLTEGEEGSQLYLVMGTNDKSPADLLGEHMGKQVEVTGEVTDAGGMKVINVAGVSADADASTEPDTDSDAEAATEGDGSGGG